MKKLLAVVMFALLSITAFAEPSFQQIESLIEKQQYAAAEQGLEQIIQAHPQSAKAFYAMAQAQAGLGHLDKAQFALNKAMGLDPDLKFASASNIESLQQAITPQVKKIEVVEESHFWRNFMFFVLFCIFAVALVFFYGVYARGKDEEDKGTSGGSTPPKSPPPPPGNYNSTPASTTSYASAPSMSNPSINPTPAPAASAAQPTVVNHYHTTTTNNSGNDMLTGVLVGEMLAGSHHHDTVIVQQPTPVYVQTPAPVYVAPTPEYTAPSRSSSWDDTPAPSKSSSWDDDSSSKSSSSWGSSSSSSSSWDSDSSSSSSSWSDSSSSDSSSSSDW